jgi:hypothetical protein
MSTSHLRRPGASRVPTGDDSPGIASGCPENRRAPSGPRPSILDCDGLAQHVTMRLVDDRTIAPCVASRRAAARAILTQGQGRELVAFRIVDTHVHALLVCSRVEASAFAQETASSIHKRLALPVGFERARVRPVVDQRHLVSAFRYVLRQESRHAVCLDPVHDGSSLPELLGMRTIAPWVGEAVGRRLPRLDRRELASFFGAFGSDPGVDFGLLADSACAALALSRLDGKEPEHVRARAAAARVDPAPAAEVAARLGVSVRAVERYRRAPRQPPLERAIALQLRLRAALATRVSEGAPRGLPAFGARGAPSE